MNKCYLVCNQLEHIWEIRNNKHDILHQGTLEEMETKIKELNIILF